MDWEETETIEQKPLPVITVILVLINVGTYLYTEWKGSSLDAEFMIDMGAMYEPAFVEGHEYYRIITHFFLHFGLEHLVNNMIALLVLGYTLEQDIGRIRYLILYMLSGILAGFVSVYVNWSLGENVVSCGASGAIYGLMGALLMVLLKNRKQIVRGDILRFGIYLVLSLYSGMQDTGIDNTAHLSGVVAGFILCSVLYQRKNKTDIRIGGY
mgnify:FL=1